MVLETLKKQKEFDLVYKKGKVFFGKNISLKTLPLRNKEDQSRYAIVISTKVNKKAVERNKKKRQMREIIRLLSQDIEKGFYFLVIFQIKPVLAGYEELEGEFVSLAKKSGLLK